MLQGICVNELHHSCEMMAQLGKQKCKVWQFKRMCFVSVCKQHLRDGMHKSWLTKKKKTWRGGVGWGGFRRLRFFATDFHLAVPLPKRVPTGVSVETRWQEMKLKLLNTDVLMCARLRSWLCVFLRGTYINENTKWKEKRCQACHRGTEHCWVCECST